MTKQDHRFGASEGRPHSRNRRHSSRRISRAPLFLESLEPRNLLANGWLANIAPFSLDSSDAVLSPMSFDQGGISAQDDSIGSGLMMMSVDMHGDMAVGTHDMGDHHDCCRPLPATPTSETSPDATTKALAADMHGDHHDCCRPLPAVSVKSGTPMLISAAVPDSGLESQEAVGDHHDCCRPLPAVSVKSGTPTLISAAILDGGVESQEAVGDHHDCCRPLPATPEATESEVATGTMAVSLDTHGDHHDCCRPVPVTPITSPAPATTAVVDDPHRDHHDCCRPLPAVSGRTGTPTVTAETAPSPSSAISAELAASPSPAISGDGESSQGQPVFSLAPPTNPAPVFSQPPVVPQLWDAQRDGSRSVWPAATGSATPWESHRTRWMNGTSVPSIRPQTKQANDEIAATTAYAAAVDSLMLDRNDLLPWDVMNTAEGEGDLVPNFALLDLNPASATYQQTVSPRDYLGSVSVWFFGYST